MGIQSNKKIIKTGPSASFLFASFRCLRFIISIGLLLALLQGCTETSDQLVYSGMTMGTSYQVKIVPGDASVDENLGDQIDHQLQSLDKSFTTYNKTSELMIFNQSAINVSQAISQDMVEVLGIAQEVFILTHGAFDPTVGPLVNLWGFGPEDTHDGVPTSEIIDPLVLSIGFNHLLLDKKNQKATRQKDIQLDLSAVAKGYAVDAVAKSLTSKGLKNYLVEVGGELCANGHKSNGQPWRVAIEQPSLYQGDIQQAISLENIAVATSGDYRNYFEKNGKRYSHTIDPRTGYPLDHSLASVTVIAKTAARADALATAMMVLGPEGSLSLAEENNIAIYILIKQGENFKVQYSSAFIPYLSGD
ncbi:MAG: FAD:protein FMN transferase [Porticoccus sp.]|nr:FAD:protein FMN transferase [Porticoccus sp.]